MASRVVRRAASSDVPLLDAHTDGKTTGLGREHIMHNIYLTSFPRTTPPEKLQGHELAAMSAGSLER